MAREPRWLLLRDILAELYPTTNDALRVSRLADFPIESVILDTSSRVRWHEILYQADSQKKIASIATVVWADHSDDPRLLVALNALSALEGRSLPSEVPLLRKQVTLNKWTRSSNGPPKVRVAVISDQDSSRVLSIFDARISRSGERAHDGAIKYAQTRFSLGELVQILKNQEIDARDLVNSRPNVLHIEEYGKLRRPSQLAGEIIQLLSYLPRKPLCVVLDGCSSLGAAIALTEHVDYIVGVARYGQRIRADAFLACFYDTLAEGLDIDGAFTHAKRVTTGFDETFYADLFVASHAVGVADAKTNDLETKIGIENDSSEGTSIPPSKGVETATEEVPKWRLYNHLSRLKIDPYLHHMFSSAESLLHVESDDLGESFRPVLVPALVHTRSAEWTLLASLAAECKIYSRVGNVFSCRLSRRAVEQLAHDPAVLSVEASRPGGMPEGTPSLPCDCASHIHRCGELGEGALIAILDAGIDVLHEAFLDAAGRTRILAVWDQRGTAGPCPVVDGIPLYGTLHTGTDINKYIASNAVPTELGRDPGGHGTHVASIAAGRAVGGFGGGVAPDAKLVVVITKIDADPGDPLSLGYSASHVDALAFVREMAIREGLPVVVNLSQGMNAGAHDGSSPLEAAVDGFTEGGRAPGRVIVKSAGNEGQFKGHAWLDLQFGQRSRLEWTSSSSRRRADYVELWFSPAYTLRARLKHPSGVFASELMPAFPSTSVYEEFVDGTRATMTYTSSHYDNGDSRLTVLIEPHKASGIATGIWALELSCVNATPLGDGIHAWVERNNSRAVEFINHVHNGYTLSVPGTARHVITVAAIDKTDQPEVAPFSSCGPTRDGRYKPDTAAPGCGVEAAQAGYATGVCTLDGTSQSAPHVSGAIALLMSAWGKQRTSIEASGQRWRQLGAAQIARALQNSARNGTGRWTGEMGYGPLDVNALLLQFIGVLTPSMPPASGPLSSGATAAPSVGGGVP